MIFRRELIFSEAETTQPINKKFNRKKIKNNEEALFHSKFSPNNFIFVNF